MGFELKDRFETTDGSRPDASPLSTEQARKIPLSAFTVLAGGDVFEATAGIPPRDGSSRARAWFDRNVEVESHGCSEATVARVTDDVVRQLGGNVQLVERLLLAKPLLVQMIPPGLSLARFGYPANVGPSVSGLYWDHVSWDRARIALRRECVDQEPGLTVHEFAHAIHYLAFTRQERDAIYNVLRPTFGSRSAMDEVFAIYSEREFLDGFGDAEKRAPGVYGWTRRQWNENHVFTRFIRKLYTPFKPLAGPKLGGRKNPFV